MNKLFKKIVGAALGLTMAIGVGVAVSRNAKEATPVHATDQTDTLNASKFAATTTTYTAFSGVSATSDAVYAGTTAKTSKGGIQLRSKNSDSGIITTSSGGKLKSISIVIESGSNTIDFYGKTSAYSSVGDLYNTNKGTKIGSASTTGSVTLTNPENYTYLGIRSYSGACYITSISVTWTSGDTKTLSSITVSEDHRSFSVGDTFVKETVTAHYSDSSTADVTSSATFSGYNMSQTGNQTVTVTYVENSVTKTTTYSITVNSADFPSATLTPDEESYNVGDSFSISANFNEYCTGTTSVSVISEDEEKVFNTFYIDNVLTGDFRLAGEVTFKAYNDSTVVETITVCVGLSGDLKAVTKVPKIGGYSKVTKTNDLTDGKYLIVCENQNVAFNGGLETLDAVSNTVAISISNDKINLNGDVDLSSAEFTFTASNGSFKGTGGKYFGNSSNSNGLTSSATALTNTVSVSNGNVDIVSSGGAYLRYNKTSGQTRFRYYKSSTYTSQEPIQLYKFSSGEGFSYNEQDVSPSLYNFVRQVYTCDYNGSSEISSWNNAKSLYTTLCDNQSLDNADKTILKTCVSKDPNNETKTTFSLLSDFITKYDRYVCKYLESDQLTTIDYLERFTTEGAGDRSLSPRVTLLNNLIFENNSSTWIIAVISVVGLSAIGGYFFYRKRKEI